MFSHCILILEKIEGEEVEIGIVGRTEDILHIQIMIDTICIEIDMKKIPITENHITIKEYQLQTSRILRECMYGIFNTL